MAGSTSNILLKSKTMELLKLPFTLLLFCSLGMLTACFSDDPSKKEPIEQLPPLTTTGERTFGALVNGEAFVVRITHDIVAIYQGGGLQIAGGIDNNTIDQNLRIVIRKLISKNQEYTLDDYHNADFNNQIKGCWYKTDDNYTGKVKIVHLDEQNFIVSGTFEFDAWDDDCKEVIHVTDGRFDLKYSP